MDINTVRIVNLRRLVHQAGSIKAFADKVGTDPSYVSALLSPKIRRNPGDKFMRTVEQAFELSPGTLDFPEETSIAAAMALTVLPADRREEALSYIDHLISKAGPLVANQPAAADYLKMRQEPKATRAGEPRKRRKPPG